ncbi:DNA polymerase III subunit epsilon [Thermithiobacillus plumbiphilus]|uniref:DNA polymerase III subunit epsilon n=1 Tax=Thermithiobacillus plumbiphilus TaxID=1729899 RepID=A0ABU9D755_9PROT
MTRQVVLDTETTGLEVQKGHRIIEIGCVEVLNRRIGERHFHCYLNPEREIDEGAMLVHGISNEMLQDKPRFREIAADFLAFVEGAQLIIHNAAFDMGFLDRELSLMGEKTLSERCDVIDTLKFARARHPGQKNDLDSLCRRYSVDNSRRDKHGALLDAEILAQVYLTMTGGQVSMLLDADTAQDARGAPSKAQMAARLNDRQVGPLRILQPSPDELAAHASYLQGLDKESKGQCVWLAER